MDTKPKFELDQFITSKNQQHTGIIRTIKIHIEKDVCLITYDVYSNSAYKTIRQDEAILLLPQEDNSGPYVLQSGEIRTKTSSYGTEKIK